MSMRLVSPGMILPSKFLCARLSVRSASLQVTISSSWLDLPNCVGLIPMISMNPKGFGDPTPMLLSPTFSIIRPMGNSSCPSS